MSLDAAGADFIKSHPIGAEVSGRCESDDATFGCYGIVEAGKLIQEPCED